MKVEFDLLIAKIPSSFQWC